MELIKTCQGWARDDFLTLRQATTQQSIKAFLTSLNTKIVCPSESKCSFDTKVGGNLTSENVLAIKQCQIVATAVGSRAVPSSLIRMSYLRIYVLNI